MASTRGRCAAALLQRVHDAVEVILRIRLVVRVPDRLFAEDDAAVDDRRDLAIAAAEIEPDPASFEMTAERLGFRVLRREIAACWTTSSG